MSPHLQSALLKAGLTQADLERAADLTERARLLTDQAYDILDKVAPFGRYSVDEVMALVEGLPPGFHRSELRTFARQWR